MNKKYQLPEGFITIQSKKGRPPKKRDVLLSVIKNGRRGGKPGYALRIGLKGQAVKRARLGDRVSIAYNPDERQLLFVPDDNGRTLARTSKNGNGRVIQACIDKKLRDYWIQYQGEYDLCVENGHVFIDYFKR